MTAKKANTKKATTQATKKPARKPAAKQAAAKKKLSALDAAAQVLAESGTAMTTGELIEAMAQKKLWESPNGKTPAATLYAAMLRELNTKGKDSRFKRTEPGKFAATAAATKADAEEPTSAPAAAKGSKKKPGGRKATPPAAVEAPTTAPTAEATPAA